MLFRLMEVNGVAYAIVSKIFDPSYGYPVIESMRIDIELGKIVGKNGAKTL